MSKEEIRKKIASCKALQGMTVAELIGTDRFRENLAKYMKAQFDDRRAIQQSYAAMHKMGGAKGYKLPAHPIDRVMYYTVGEFAAEYMAVLNKQSNLPANVRMYIKQLGDQSYSLTVIQYVVDEYPELADELLPKSKRIKMDTKVQANKRQAAIRKIIGALMGGRHLSVYNDREFDVSEMHTCFCVIRQKIRDGKITGYVMKDCWRTNANGIRYKEYWFEDAQN